MPDKGELGAGTQRNRVMASLRTDPIDDITFDDVREFCAQRLPENLGIEYKLRIESGVKVAKEVAAFANTAGGVIIYGVDETEDRIPEDSPPGQELGSDPRATIIDACHSHIFPSAAIEVTPFIKSPTDERIGFVVVRVEASERAPHTTDDGRRVYVRIHDRSVPATARPETEVATLSRIEHMLSRRDAKISIQDQRVIAGIDRLQRILDTGQRQPFMAVAIGPKFNDSPDEDRGRLANARPPNFPQVFSNTADGIYCAPPGERAAWLADVYGNRIFSIASGDLLQDFRPREALIDSYFPWIKYQMRPEGSLLAIEARAALRPAVLAVSASIKWLQESGFHVPIRV